MRGRERNPAFFQNNGGGSLVSDVVVATSGAPRGGHRATSATATSGGANIGGGIQAQLRRARSSGALVITDRKLSSIPPAVFLVESAIDEDEKFWEIQPVVRVDLSNNEITSVPADISNLSSMVSFKIRHNKITEISSALFSCVNIGHLDLSNNKLTSIPVEIGRLEMLLECHFGGNSISEVPSTLFNCSKLQLLDFTENLIDRLPENIGRLAQLTKLRLGVNRLSSLPASIGSLSMLQELILNKNRLDRLPPLSGLTSLVFLDATDNKITSYPLLPSSGVSKLARLYLGNNSIVSLDEYSLLCGELSLVELDMQGNHISDIPPDIGRLSKLKALNVANNDLTDVPYTLGYMGSLQRIQLDGNPIRTIRRTLLTQSPSDLKAYLRTRGPEPPYIRAQEAQFHFADDVNELDARIREMSGGVLNISGLELTTLPRDFVSKLYRGHSLESDDTTLRLVHLNLSKNHIAVIPSEILDISTLQVLDISANRLGDTSPDDLFCSDRMFPESLRYLDVSKNRLDDAALNAILNRVPTSASGPSHAVTSQTRSAHSKLMPHKPTMQAVSPGLQSLICRENRLTEVSRLLYRQTHTLRELQISFNQIRVLDGIDFAQFNQLEIFDASNNKLVSLGNVACAANLNDLLVANNDLNEIPPEVSLLKKLRNLSIMGNPQKTVRLNVVQQGTEAIIKFLKNRLPEGAGDGGTQTASRPSSSAPSHAAAPSSLRHEIARGDNVYLGSTVTNAVKVHRATSEHGYYPAAPTLEHQHVQRGSSAGTVDIDVQHRRIHPATVSLIEESRDRVLHEDSDHSAASSHRKPQAVESAGACRMARSASSGPSSNDAGMREIEAQIERMKNELEFSGLSEAKRFAIKKEMAKARANLLRLQRISDAGV